MHGVDPDDAAVVSFCDYTQVESRIHVPYGPRPCVMPAKRDARRIQPTYSEGVRPDENRHTAHIHAAHPLTMSRAKTRDTDDVSTKIT